MIAEALNKFGILFEKYVSFCFSGFLLIQIETFSYSWP